jgi:hypothetical protein
MRLSAPRDDPPHRAVRVTGIGGGGVPSRIALLALVVLALFVQACDAAVVNPSPGAPGSGGPSQASGDLPAEPTPSGFLPSGPLPTIDPAVIAAPALTCGIDSASFPPEALSGPGAELAPDAAAAALREFILTEPTPEYPFPRAGWHRVVQTADHELFVASTPGDPPWLAVAFTRANGAWAIDAYGACTLSVALPGGIGLADWWVDPAAAPPTPQSTRIPVLLVEKACAGGKPPVARVLAPVVVYRPDAVVITIAVATIPGGSDCIGNPSVSLVVELTEPLRDRLLLDGGTVPPRAPVPPS